MPTSKARLDAMKRYNEAHKNDPEFKRRKAEAQKKWKDAHRAEINEKRRQKNAEKRIQVNSELFYPPNPKYAEFDSEPSTEAAYANHRHRFSFIVGEYHYGSKHVILERMHNEGGRTVYRLKITQYFLYATETEAAEWCESHHMKLSRSRIPSDESTSSDIDSIAEVKDCST